ncbi:MAG: L,D-transpeptidase family protein [Sphingomonadales bacterium]|nr:L,D-transpeptidase family protein [Sphingomonadales bacterium]
MSLLPALRLFRWLLAPLLLLVAAPVQADWLALDEVVATPESQGPIHLQRSALEAALATERDPRRRAILRANLDRWRALPGRLGRRHIFVNAASQQVELWEDGRLAGRWAAIVGTPRTPTPSFSAEVSGVNLNPWWYIPQSIVRESVGALVRNRPAEAQRLGYVVSDGGYRQRPGPSNALGRMKLVMPNNHAVFLHDTPSRRLFAEEQRAYSHGCIRVEDAMGFAAVLLGTDKSSLEAERADGRTRTVPLAEPVPVHIGYFTAVADAAGGVRYLDDIYGRDG